MGNGAGGGGYGFLTEGQAQITSRARELTAVWLVLSQRKAHADIKCGGCHLLHVLIVCGRYTRREEISLRRSGPPTPVSRTGGFPTLHVPGGVHTWVRRTLDHTNPPISKKVLMDGWITNGCKCLHMFSLKLTIII